VTHTSAREANLLGTLSLAVAGAMESAVQSPLGPSAPAALVALDGYLAGEPIDALRHVLGLTHSGAVRLVDRLEAAGLAERRPGPDGRSVAVALTRRGTAAARAVRAEREAALEHALSALAPAERATLTALHEKLLARLTGDRASARRMCRLCDVDACGHHRGTCPVTNARAAASPAA
jgi:MarR family transcriptional regulator, negative regulator of the multidrug operon emrRAB